MSEQQTAVDPTRTPSVEQRSVMREIEIDVPVDIVWKALTDAEELVRWFPVEARVNPELGGSIWMRWDDTEFDAGKITVWEPGQHLRTEDLGGTWAGVATDYFLRPTPSGRGTILRVVSSGFGEGEAWNEALDAFGSGWDFELRGLRHYLTRHRGERRVALRARVPYQTSHADAWNRVVGPSGWLGVDPSVSLEPGERLAARTRTGHALRGLIHHVKAPRQLVVELEQWNNAFFRVQLYGGAVWLWASTYGVPETEVAEVRRTWQDSLASELHTPA
jgi:uncharacterized protein YndB with AHSA1/START domain